MYFNHLNYPTAWRAEYSKYPEGLSILESLMQWIKQVDDMVDSHNANQTTITGFGGRLDSFIAQYDTHLQATLTETLSAWQASGFLDVVIDAALQTEMDNLVTTTEQALDSFSEQLTQKQTVVNIKSFGAVGDGVTDDSDAIQNALNSLPFNDIDTKNPKLYPTGGVIYIPTGLYKVSKPLDLQRGTIVRGDTRESSQIYSTSITGVFRYTDKGRYIQDEIGFENLSIWQDDSIIPTSGAGIEVVDGTATIPSITLSAKNIIIQGTHMGIILSAGVGSTVENVNIANTVSHGVYLAYRENERQLSTSTTFLNTYSQLCGGSGYFLEDSAYVSFIGSASDANGRYGYELEQTANIFIHGGAEQNIMGGVKASGALGTTIHVDIVDNPTANSDAVTLEGCFSTTVNGVHHSKAEASGFSVRILNTGGTTICNRVATGGWNTNLTNNPNHMLNLTSKNSGFTGGNTRRWAFGLPSPNSTNMLEIGGTVESGVTAGLKISPEFSEQSVRGVHEGLNVSPKVGNTAVTHPIIIGLGIGKILKGVLSTITRAIGFYVPEQSEGTTGNTNMAIGTTSPQYGDWNIYSNSPKENVWFGANRFVSPTGPIQKFGNGSPEGVVTAPVGSYYSRTDGAAGATFYVKETGTGATGWVSK